MEEKQRRFRRVTWVMLAMFALAITFMAMPMHAKADGQAYLPVLRISGQVSNSYPLGTRRSSITKDIAPANVSSVEVHIDTTVMKKSGDTWKKCYDTVLLGGVYKIVINVSSTMDGDTLYYYTENTKVIFDETTYGSENAPFVTDCTFTKWNKYSIELESRGFVISGGDYWLDPSEGTLWIAESFTVGNVQAYADDAEVKKVVTLDSAVFPAYCGGLFKKFKATEFDLTQGDSSKVTNVSKMFRECSQATTIKQSLDTSQVTDMSEMFYGCSKLETIKLSNFDTSNVTNMHAMFESCASLTSIDVSKFDTSKVTDMAFMFLDCSGLKTLDLSSLDTSKVTSLQGMLRGCTRLETVDFTGFNTSKVKSMQSMFSSCEQLTDVDVSMFDTSSVTSLYAMFYKCTSLTSLDLSSFDVSKVTDFGEMFDKCSSLRTLDLSSFKPAKATKLAYMFYAASSLETIYASELWEIGLEGQFPDSTDMFKDCGNLVGGNGTAYNSSHRNREYARIDKEGQEGYFTATPKTAIFEKSSNTLYLRGNVVKNDVRAFVTNAKLKKVVALEGTSLPKDSSSLF